MLVRCVPCGGSGKVLWLGGVAKDCPTCVGNGKVEEPEDEINYLIEHKIEPEQDLQTLADKVLNKNKPKTYDRRTISFKNAKAKLVKAGKSEIEAEQLLGMVK